MSRTSAVKTRSRARAIGRRRALHRWQDSLRVLLVFAGVALAVRTCGVMPRSIPSESMMPRLVVGDYLLVAKWPYGFSRFSPPIGLPAPHGRLFGHVPRRGDIVVFRAPPDDRDDYIKRVIGVPGDTVQMQHGRVRLNGRLLPRIRIADFVLPLAADTACRSIAAPPYGITADASGRAICRLPRYRETLPDGRSYETIDQGTTMQDDGPPIVIPPGRYFMLGDNRDMSEDSRFPVAAGGIGLVPADNLEGRALVTIFSTGGGARWRQPHRWIAAVRLDRIGRGFG